ncbi:hypothetical protein, partial [Sphingomonas bacterium]|uniref:hypothetical protein n=1 Tax=Sphingomonas bacterium TaxID=1895847 RepID=UPI001C2D9679
MTAQAGVGGRSADKLATAGNQVDLRIAGQGTVRPAAEPATVADRIDARRKPRIVRSCSQDVGSVAVRSPERPSAAIVHIVFDGAWCHFPSGDVVHLEF